VISGMNGTPDPAWGRLLPVLALASGIFVQPSPLDAQDFSVSWGFVASSHESVPNSQGPEFSVTVPLPRSLRAEVWYRSGTGSFTELEQTCDLYWPEYTGCLEEPVKTRNDQRSLGFGLQKEFGLPVKLNLGIGAGLSFLRVDVQKQGLSTGRLQSPAVGEKKETGWYGSLSLKRGLRGGLGIRALLVSLA
jgi:hypothetical protein